MFTFGDVLLFTEQAPCFPTTEASAGLNQPALDARLAA